jgi:hypothetical protein
MIRMLSQSLSRFALVGVAGVVVDPPLQDRAGDWASFDQGIDPMIQNQVRFSVGKVAMSAIPFVVGIALLLIPATVNGFSFFIHR